MSWTSSSRKAEPAHDGIDQMSTHDILVAINDEDSIVPAAVRATLPAIEKAVEAIVAASARAVG